jgi:hypothetical protein
VDLSTIDETHRNKLRWFEQNSGREVPYELLDQNRLVTKAKGIFKPKDTEYALSIRQVIGSRYNDGEVARFERGVWKLEYAQEGDTESDLQSLYANRGLLACMRDSVPVGVLIQTRPKPNTTYFVVGTALVMSIKGNLFVLIGPASIDHIASYTRIELAIARTASVFEESEAYDASSVDDARERIAKEVALRRGQPRFRTDLLEAYQGQCSMSGSRVIEALEAAHITPYRGRSTNQVSNGLLLRCDHHTLFDLGLIAVNEDDYTILISPRLADSEYEYLSDRQLVLPSDVNARPDEHALRRHREWSGLGLRVS